MLKNNINIMVGTKVSSCKELIVWQKAMDLVAAVYKLTDNYPKTELYGLVSQTKRSAISIVSNIAEGRRRGTKKDFRHFLIMSFGPGAELETQIEIAKRLSFGNENDFTQVDGLLDEIMRMLNKMTSSLQATS